MHPFSPHAPSAAARHPKLGATSIIGDPASARERDARAHVAAEELRIRRPRRPAARRAGFRTPPAS